MRHAALAAAALVLAAPAMAAGSPAGPQGHAAPGAPGAPGLEAAVALAREAMEQERRALGLPPMPPPALPDEDLGPAAARLAARHGAALAPGDAQALEGLPPGVARPLARVVGAFLALEDAGAGLAGALPALPGPGADPGPASEAWERARPRLAAVHAARAGLLDAMAALATALRAAGSLPVHVQAPPALALDLAGGSDTYTANFALQVDAAGHDTYANNAGGSNLFLVGCPSAGSWTSAALLDLEGNDRYGTARHCGFNGGGELGTGFLLDAAGDDAYLGGSFATNGGGALGLGFLLDAAGQDSYAAGGGGTNGGGYVGAGLLVDAAGHDTYGAGSGGANGGAQLGAGRLVDGAGNDRYAAGSLGANGGGYLAGAGALLDLGGDDAYEAREQGANGGAAGTAAGLLLDLGGRDAYRDAAGACADCTVAPKGLAGAQLDLAA